MRSSASSLARPPSINSANHAKSHHRAKLGTSRNLAAIIHSMQDLQAVFGDRFLAYVLACNGDDLASTDWSPVQSEVISQLGQVRAIVESQDPLQRQLTLTSLLLQHDSAAGMSIVNAWRSSCGGYVPTLPDEVDACLAALWQMAVDTYAGFLLPVNDDSPFRYSYATGSLFRHPAQINFCRAVLDDNKLCTFFPGAAGDVDLQTINGLTEIHSSISLSIGRGGSFQLVMLAETLMHAAHNFCLLDGDDTIDAYLEKVKAVLGDARYLADDQSVDVPVVVGMNNIVLPEGEEIELPWGKVRRSMPSDRKFFPVHKDVAAVLLLATPVRVLSKEEFVQRTPEQMAAGFECRMPAIEAWSNDLRRTVDLTRYAMILASAGQELIGVTQQSTCIIDPLQGVPSMSWAFDLPPATATVTLDSESICRVERWGRRLGSHPRKLDIAMRRTLSGAVDRLDPLDGFIDAVLAWENMFSDTPETTLKVCGSIAQLLERGNIEARKQLYKELQQLYGKRSKVVHGAIDMNSRDAVAARKRAIEIAVDAMRTLYDYPHLLNKDSATRGKEILLGALDDAPPRKPEDVV